MGAGMSATSRQEHFDVRGPVDAVVEIDAGRVDVRLAPATAEGSPEVRVEVTADLEGAPGWVRGLAGLVEAAGGLERRFGFDLGAIPGLGVRPGEDPEERAARAVAAVEITLEDGRLVVHGPREVVLRAVPLHVTVHAPADGGVTVHAGAAPVDVTGRPGPVDIGTTGGVTVEEVVARSSVRCGAGDVAIRRVAGVLRVKGGAGDVTLAEVAAPVEVITGSGSVTADRVAADLVVRCGSGDVTVRDASAGNVDLTTGAGSVRVGVHAGVDASVDLRSAAGSASSDLPVTSTRPESTPGTAAAPLRIRGRAAAGSARVQSAAPA
jgi:putative adhesin